MRARIISVALAVSLTAVAGCSSPSTNNSPTANSSAQQSNSATSTAPGHAQSTSGLPTQAELDAALADAKKLTTKQLAGQVVVGFFQGTSPQAAAATLKRNNLGGLIVMGDNLPADGNQATAAKALTSGIQKAMSETGRNWPAVIGVDQEGGPVQRLKAPVMQLPGGMAMGAANNAAVQTAATKALGQELRALGFTMVNAPDADVTIGPTDPTIGMRSPGKDPKRVADAVVAQVKGFQEAGIVPVIKHFPGHGSVTADTHVGIVAQPHSVDWLSKRDWVPFAQAISAGAPAVMTGHISLQAVDAPVPATLSPKVIQGQLRDKLGFKGLVITDAMNMGAIVKKFDGNGAAAVSALKAGADVVLMPANDDTSVGAIVAAIETGVLNRADVEKSAARIIATMRHQNVKQPDVSVVGTHDAQAQNLAKASITQLKGVCGRRMVGQSVTLVEGSASERERMAKALKQQGISVTNAGTKVALLSAEQYNAGKASAAGGSQADGTAARGSAATQAPVQIALGTPYVLEQRGSDSIGLAAYGNSQATLDVLAQVLAGKVKPSGTLPVQVGKQPIGTSACAAG